MAIEGGGSRIVQDGLIRDRDGEDGSEDESRLSGTEGERDIKSQDKAKNMRSVEDGSQIHGRLFRLREGNLVGLVVILPVLVGELKLRTPFLSQSLFPVVQFIHVP